MTPPASGTEPDAASQPAPHPALGRIQPMKAVVEGLPPDDGQWSTELKWDGMRLLVHVADDEVLLRSASGRLCTTAFPELAALGEIVPQGTVLDGEAIVMADGEPSFRALQRRIHVERPSPQLVSEVPVKFVAFDVPWFAGNDIRRLGFHLRRDALDQTIETGPSWLVSAISSGAPSDLFAVAKQRGLEGVMCKRLDSPYVSGRSAHWRKIKVRPRTDMVIGGFSYGSGALARTIGSVVVGIFDGENFVCAGSVGSGLSDSDRARLLDRFEQCEDTPFINGQIVTGPGSDPVIWVEPTLVAEIGFARWDDGEKLWQPTFHGLRVDADPYLTQYRLSS